MPTLQLKRGTTARVSSYTPLAGELVYDSTAKIIYVGDGTTAGGFPVGAGTPASTAAKLTTARAITLSGAVTGTANFDGSAAVTIATTIQNIDLGVIT